MCWYCIAPCSNRSTVSVPPSQLSIDDDLVRRRLVVEEAMVAPGIGGVLPNARLDGGGETAIGLPCGVDCEYTCVAEIVFGSRVTSTPAPAISAARATALTEQPQ